MAALGLFLFMIFYKFLNQHSSRFSRLPAALIPRLDGFVRHTAQGRGKFFGCHTQLFGEGFEFLGGHIFMLSLLCPVAGALLWYIYSGHAFKISFNVSVCIKFLAANDWHIVFNHQGQTSVFAGLFEMM